WLTRAVRVDVLFAMGGIDEVVPVVEGWNEPAAAGAFARAPAAAGYAASALATYARFEESDRLAAAVEGRAPPELLAPFDALRLVAVNLPRGRFEEVCAELEAAVEALTRSDPLNRRHHVAGALATVLWDGGDSDDSLRMW